MMNNPISNLLLRPLAINDWGAKHLRNLAFSDMPTMPQSREPGEMPPSITMDFMGNKIAAPMDTENGTRIIPLQGPITRNLGLMSQLFGMADTDRFVQWVNEAAADPNVSSIMLHIQSPGGDAIGCEEAARAVRNATASKPVISFCDDMMASAAYYIGSAADSIHVTPSCIIGSIGTYCVIVDQSEFWQNMGVEFQVIRSGKFKGAGIDGFTEEQIDEMQKMVDAFGEQFRSAIDDYRDGAVIRENMQGQVWLGKDAVAPGVGIADFLVDNRIQLLNTQLITR